ncbi:MAG: putative transrane protein [Gammaproteobacteria bacterium]|jgi:uncharacterized membrane protein YoaK (UPF0700 family)|nr:putative transrane protein [Gammaproteobacteria bacterium]
MKNREDYKAIFTGAVLLTINASFINTIVLIGIYHHAVSYMTGNLAQIGLAIETLHFRQVLAPIFIVCSFIIGAILSGIMINSSQFCINQNYAKALILLSAILAASALMMDFTDPLILDFSECLAALACGMQNAMTTTFSGAIIRTTHMTGVLTDLGIQLGRMIKGEPVETWKITLFSSLAVSFIVGSIIGLLLFSVFKTQAMWVSVIGCFLIGLSYYLWKRSAPKKL